MTIKKLIEVALPLETINAESAREKSIRHGHPSTLHLWWARRPLAAARAVIWSSLVDDPSSHPEKFPTEEEQNSERRRLFGILERLVKWENSNDETLLAEAKAEILKCTDGVMPELLDPFAGGGAIPLEAQRLGLKAHAHDLNPVAVMINKAMIEIPPRFADKPPVNPEARALHADVGWSGSSGLADDVRWYGAWMKEQAFARIGHLYPKVTVPKEQGGGEATVIAWLWARTVKCPNPVCGCEMPLASSFVLSKKKGKEAYVEPIFNGKELNFVVNEGACPKDKVSCKLAKGAEFKCVNCGAVANKPYIHEEFVKKRNGAVLMAIVAEGSKGRLYLSPSQEQAMFAYEASPIWEPEEFMDVNTPNLVSGRGYGITQWKEIFTKRQLMALTTFSDLVAEAQKKAEADAAAAGMADDHVPLCEGGSGARAYGEAVGVYLAFAVDKLDDRGSSICIWDTTRDGIANTLRRQAIPMTWDFAEGNPFSNSSGCFDNMLNWIIKSIMEFPVALLSEVRQADAKSDCGLRNVMISTDPPYYDNIGYADLSDFFYVWLRRSLKGTYPELFGTMLTPKADELIATPSRHGGSKEKAKQFFERGMHEACEQMCRCARGDIPVTVYYAYKQSDTDAGGTASTGWETMLSAIINSGFAITGTWPMRTELTTALKSNVNALASSIVLVCRKRPADAPEIERRRFITTLRRELSAALKKLQQSNIAPVDLAQSAIGPGMGVFSRYARVLDADGTPMTVRDALKVINEALDWHFNEQEGEMDPASRFCVDLYSQFSFGSVKYGEAETLATAKNTSIPMMAARGVLHAKGGVVRLLERSELKEQVDPHEECIWLLTQQLTQAMEKGGVEACARILTGIFGSNGDRAKDLAYRLHTIAEREGRTAETFAYNALVAAWPEVQARAAALKANVPEQLGLSLDAERGR